jgi:hypothetical protein
MRTKLFQALFVAAGIFVLGGIALSVEANHSWAGYHFARTTNPLALKLGDNVSFAWKAHLAAASVDWTVSDVLDTAIVAGGTNALKGRNTPKNCLPTSGRVEVCSAKYGSTGWLGIASVWTIGSHITKGAVKMNDTYFNTPTYNTPAWRSLVMCQEIGHTFGLNHQDETFDNANLGTCMDYTNDPSGLINGQLGNEHPNFHDYEELGIIYAHTDTINTAQAETTSNGKSTPARRDMDSNDPSAWGKAVKQDARGNNSLFVRDFGNGEKVFTFVVWAE